MGAFEANESAEAFAADNFSSFRSSKLFFENKSTKEVLEVEQVALPFAEPSDFNDQEGSAPPPAGDGFASLMNAYRQKKEQLDQEWARAKEERIAKTATLGDLALMDEIKHLRPPSPSEEEIFGFYLGIPVQDAKVTSRSFGGLVDTRVLSYTLLKLFQGSESHSYKLGDVSIEIEDGAKWSLPTGINRTNSIPVGVDKYAQVPYNMRFSVTTPDNRKACVRFEQTNSGFSLTIYSASLALNSDFFDWISQQMKLNNFFKGGKITPEGTFLPIKEHNWDDIVLAAGLKEKIENNIMKIFSQEEIYLTNGISPKRGFALVGPPGTGKTLLTKILAWQLKEITFIWVSPQSVWGSSAIASIYEMAQDLAPSIVFFEDADIYLSERNLSGGNSTILTELMNRLDGIVPVRGVVTGLSSNRPEVLESALIRRPGRFDMVLEMGPPDLEGRKKLINRYLRKVHITSEEIDSFANEPSIDGMEPCKIEEIVKRAVMKAIEEERYDKQTLVATVKKDDLLGAVAEYNGEQQFRKSYVNESLIQEGFDSLEDKIKSFALLLSPEEMDEETIMDTSFSDDENVRAVWEEMLNEQFRMLRRLGIKSRNIREAKKLLDDEDATGTGVLMMLTGEE